MQVARAVRLGIQNSRVQLALISGALLVYLLVIVRFYAAIGPSVAALSVLPVALLAQFYGIRVGVLAALMTMMMNTVLLNLLGEVGWNVVIRERGIPGTIALFLVAMVVGRLSDIQRRLNQELDRRQRVEGELRESEARFRQLSDATFEGIAIHDRGIILDVNQSFCQIYGYERSEVIGKSALDLTAPEYRDVVIQKIATGDTRPYEGGVLRKDGTVGLVEIVGRPITYRGRVVRVAAIRDITERKKAEAQRLELALADKRKELMQEFLNTVSHDLKTPLSVINANVYVLEKLTDAEKQARLLQAIKMQVQHVGNLIQDILTISRLDTVPDLVFQPIDVNHMVSRIETNLHWIAEKKQQQIQLDLAANLPPISADAASMNRVMVNLIENALNYTPNGGSIFVKTSVQDGDGVIEIADTGIGISETDLPHIFDPFFRTDKARTTHEAGTGLGLSIVKKIVEMHGRQIEVESHQGVGSTFRVRLPLCQANAS